MQDSDGTLLGTGSSGSIVSRAEYFSPNAFGAKPPLALMSDSLGRLKSVVSSRSPISFPGNTDGFLFQEAEVIPNGYGLPREGCVFQAEWNAWKCDSRHTFAMMIIESMDGDTETRRISPLSLSSGGYTDLLNGPQDHGWCFGYTCLKRYVVLYLLDAVACCSGACCHLTPVLCRISTFFSLVDLGRQYSLYMTGTNPTHTRLSLLSTSPQQSVVIAMFYSTAQRVQVAAGWLYCFPYMFGAPVQLLIGVWWCTGVCIRCVHRRLKLYRWEAQEGLASTREDFFLHGDVSHCCQSAWSQRFRSQVTYTLHCSERRPPCGHKGSPTCCVMSRVLWHHFLLLALGCTSNVKQTLRAVSLV